VPQQRKAPIYEHGVALFRDYVARDAEIRPRLQGLLLRAIAEARLGGVADVVLLRSVLSMLVDLGISTVAVYMELFETPMLAETLTFYQTESNERIATATTSEYLVYAEARLEEERTRAQTVMHSTSLAKVMGVVENRILREHALALMEVRDHS